MARVLYERSEGGDFGRHVRVMLIHIGEFSDPWYLMESGILHVNHKPQPTDTWHYRRREVVNIPRDLGWSSQDAYAIHVGIARWNSLFISTKSALDLTDARLSSSKEALLEALANREAHDPLRG